MTARKSHLPADSPPSTTPAGMVYRSTACSKRALREEPGAFVSPGQWPTCDYCQQIEAVDRLHNETCEQSS